MPTIADIRLHREKAIAFATKTDMRTSPDTGYVAKNALSQCFGSDHGVRPFRIVDDEGDLRIVGYVDEDMVRKPTPEGKELTVSVQYLPWNCAKGDLVNLDVLACPLVSTTRVEKPGTKARGPRQIDVAKAKGTTDVLFGYSKYMTDKIGDANTGCVVHGAPRFIEKGRFQGLRKSKGSAKAVCPSCRSNGNTSWDKAISRWHCRPCSNIFSNAHTIEMPSFNAMVVVRVVSMDAFFRFLRTGIGRQRAFGYGSMLPTDVMKELDL